ncbi:MAG: hypothetical protein FJX40_10025 [Alphaproteobacteria bacterium]|nr:hypothetical protein [Alphaproteobacteria bacterium]MBM3624930.1 hypothetical protein [Alphaproteobacteria bacterium]MBM3642371.1 hypothetical protein [Alphaproteobacteria bacterium]
MSRIKLLLSAAVIVGSFAGAAQASPYYPFASWESTGAPFERCWWESGPSRPFRLCVPVAPHALGYYGYGGRSPGYNPDIAPGD